jgi:hypothetical protein
MGFNVQTSLEGRSMVSRMPRLAYFAIQVRATNGGLGVGNHPIPSPEPVN